MKLIPEEYRLRHELNQEMHNRPYEVLNPPERVSYIALLVDEEERSREWAHLRRLCLGYGHELPDAEERVIRLDLGEFRLKVERHIEYTRYEFVSQGAFDDPFADPVIARVPRDWLAQLPGKTLVAAHIALQRDDAIEGSQEMALLGRHFGGGSLIGSWVGREKCLAVSDFKIDSDGFTRFLLIAPERAPAKIGRLVLRLLEIETYRMLALMGLPEARSLNRKLADADSRLISLTDTIAHGSEASGDEELLEELSQLAVTVENLVSGSYRRFTRTRAYFVLVANRLADLGETPIDGMSTFTAFLNRRLAPAKETIDSAAQWLDQLSSRVTNASQLLRTRVDVHREEQNQQLLLAMNRRFELQLHLQLTVERLSIAVFTYYSANLVNFVATAGVNAFGWKINPLAVTAISIPFIAAAAYIIGGKVRRAIRRADKK